MLHMSDQSWNNLWKSAAKLFLVWLDRIDHQKLSYFLLVTCLQTTQQKTNQNQPKSHRLHDKNQLVQTNLTVYLLLCNGQAKEGM